MLVNRLKDRTNIARKSAWPGKSPIRRISIGEEFRRGNHPNHHRKWLALPVAYALLPDTRSVRFSA
jgi:hypothetical protein